MLLAQEHDALEGGVAYVSTARRRLIAPDTRSRVVGYLATAPLAAPGYRTDGAWVWPETLAERARTTGAAPQDQLYEHMRQRSFLAPADVSPALRAVAAEAVFGPAVPDPAADWDWVYFGVRDHAGGWADELARIRLRDDGSVAESRYTTTGWSAHRTVRSSGRQLVELSGREAADLNDRLCGVAHAARVERDRESEPPVSGPRLARVFDGESPAGRPWFSPHRIRIPEPERRQRIAAYLMGGRLVVRTTGRMVDPLDPAAGAVVPLNYRTDGVWVWQESLAHYVCTRGVAPELEFLCHIEERGCLPPMVPAEAVPVAGRAVKHGAAPRLARPAMTYRWEPTGTITRSRGHQPGDTDTLGSDLRWSTATIDPSFLRSLLGDRAAPEREFTEQEAVDFIDARWSAAVAVPPLD